MSQQKPRTITLRRLEPEAVIKKGDFTLNEIYNPDALDASDMLGETYYREVNPIPDGYEMCDLADATKVLIGDGFRDVDSRFIMNSHAPLEYGPAFDVRRLQGLGVLAIRPIPEPEPMRGEITIGPEARYGAFPEAMIGKTVRWEEVVKDGGE